MNLNEVLNINIAKYPFTGERELALQFKHIADVVKATTLLIVTPNCIRTIWTLVEELETYTRNIVVEHDIEDELIEVLTKPNNEPEILKESGIYDISVLHALIKEPHVIPPFKSNPKEINYDY